MVILLVGLEMNVLPGLVVYHPDRDVLRQQAHQSIEYPPLPHLLLKHLMVEHVELL